MYAIRSYYADGSGRVCDYTNSEIRQFDAGFRFLDADGRPAFRGRDVTVPTLDEVLRSFPDARFIVDIRSEDPAHADRLIETLERLEVSHRVIVVSEVDACLDRCRDRHPSYNFV